MLEAEGTLKLLTAETEEELLRVAEERFGRPAETLKQIRPEGGDPRKMAALFCPAEDGTNYERMDSCFHLLFEEEGVILELFPQLGDGKPLNPDVLWDYLRRKNLSGLELDSVRKLLEYEWGREKIAPPQEEKCLDEEIRIEVAPDEMSASAVLMPPDPGGASLSVEEAGRALRAAKVTEGVDTERLETLLREKTYGLPVIVALGRPAQDGADGKLTFHFNRTHEGTPWEDAESGKVDFKRLDWIERIQEGDLLVSRTLATPGTPGLTVTGKTLTPRSGRECRLPRGQKVRYDEKLTQMFAAASGKVEFNNDIVQVSDIYDINSDLDMSVGNVDFDGSVVVHGNVISKMKIRATGDVTIYGGVQDAIIEAGGDVTIINGLQGRGTGLVTAKGTLTVKFIEQGRAQAQVAVKADEVVYSEVNCGGDVYLTGKHGSVLGGVIRAGHMVVAQTVGAPSHPRTKIEVGLDPQMVKRIKSLAESLEDLRRKLEELQKISNYLMGKSMDSEEKGEKVRQVLTTRLDYMQKVQSMEAEYNELQSRLEGASDGVIHILDTVFPGAVLQISNQSYPVSGTPVRNASFRILENEIRMTGCSYSKRRK